EYLYLTRGYHSLHKLPYFANAFFGLIFIKVFAVFLVIVHRLFFETDHGYNTARHRSLSLIKIFLFTLVLTLW
ncbi:MAG: hypothetical protein ACP5JP_10170, partial [bacterium]